jgi:hypothetical protein
LTGRTFENRERLAAVGRTHKRDVGRVHDVLVLGIDLDLGEIAAASPDPTVAIDALPTFARVVGAIQSALLPGIDQRVQPVAIAGGNPNTDAS